MTMDLLQRLSFDIRQMPLIYNLAAQEQFDVSPMVLLLPTNMTTTCSKTPEPADGSTPAYEHDEDMLKGRAMGRVALWVALWVGSRYGSIHHPRLAAVNNSEEMLDSSSSPSSPSLDSLSSRSPSPSLDSLSSSSLDADSSLDSSFSDYQPDGVHHKGVDEVDKLIEELLEETFGSNSWLQTQADEINRSGLSKKRTAVDADQEIPGIGPEDPGDPHADGRGCAANRMKKQKLTTTDNEFEEDLEQPQPQPTFIVSAEPQRPSVEVMSKTSALLSKLMGVLKETSEDFVEKILRIVSVAEWKEESGALTSNTLLHLAQQLKHVEEVDIGSRFVRIMNELFFAAKINGIILHNSHSCPPGSEDTSAEHSLEEKRRSRKRSLCAAVDKLALNGITEYITYGWISAGSRWGRSIYLLMIIAASPDLPSTLRSRSTVNATILALCNEIRSPQTPTSLSLMREFLVPLVSSMQAKIPFQIPSMFSPLVHQVYKLPEVLNCQDLLTSDTYFDLFHQNIYVCLPRNTVLWKSVQSFHTSSDETLPFDHMNTRYLCLSSKTISIQTAEDLSEYEELNNFSDNHHPIHFTSHIDSDDHFTVLSSCFSLQSTLDHESKSKSTPPYRSKKATRQKKTEDFRKQASNAKHAETLEDLSSMLLENYAPDTGRLIPNKGWIMVPQSLITGSELQVNDREGNLMFYTNGMLSQHKRLQLELALQTWSQAVQPLITGVELKDQNSALKKIKKFSVFHFSFWSKFCTKAFNFKVELHKAHPLYGIIRSDNQKTNTSQFFPYASSDIQKFASEYALLCDSLEDILQEIVTKTLARHPDQFKEINGMIDIIPLHDLSPVKPFTSFVLNLNVTTLLHKDHGDKSGCIVLSIGSHTGGELCLLEPRLALQLRHGDWVVFPSQHYTHFNLHYSGVRASLVIQSDKEGTSYEKNGNGWDMNIFVT
ncbi:hypothetical protein EV361DRAFT_1020368 [Lentinula raphanica]|nr:hypothetical protein EV361DRAFT_1020368 [Lentinula raphanica]